MHANERGVFAPSVKGGPVPGRENPVPALTSESRDSGRGLRLDPRTKLVAMLVMAAAVALAPSVTCEAVLMVLAAVFGVLLGRWRASVAMLLLYAMTLAAVQFVPQLKDVALRTMLFSFALLVRKVFACSLMAYATVATTHVNELMSVLAKVGAPRTVAIPVAVALRYLPAVREDWGYIRDAMRMRGVSPSPLGFMRDPMRTIDCIYAPLLMSASRASDELAMAAVARGIENPVQRTCYLHISMDVADYVVLSAFLVAMVGTLVLKVLA